MVRKSYFGGDWSSRSRSLHKELWDLQYECFGEDCTPPVGFAGQINDVPLLQKYLVKLRRRESSTKRDDAMHGMGAIADEELS